MGRCGIARKKINDGMLCRPRSLQTAEEKNTHVWKCRGEYGGEYERVCLIMSGQSLKEEKVHADTSESHPVYWAYIRQIVNGDWLSH